jgi:DNA-binding GntR family transcriptional regulator
MDLEMTSGAGLARSQLRRGEQVQIIKHLEEDIIFGRVAPGSRLVEDALMARYGGTRHFIRQALAHLERTGIVKREKNVGANEVRQIYEVREMLTRQAILMIPLPASRAFIQRLSLIQTDYCRLAGSGNLRSLHETNDAFHLTLFSACGNTYLVRTLQDYMNLTLPMRAKNLADSAGLDTSRHQHALMIELLAGRDSWALAQLSVEHMQYSKSDYLERISTQQRFES